MRHAGNPLAGKIVGYNPKTGEIYYANAGLGKVYPISLPIIGNTTVDIPVDLLAHDMVGEAGSDLWKRFKANWYYFAAGGLIVAATVAALRR